MPFRSSFKSNEEYNAWFREYRRKNAEKLRAYNRKYNHEWRLKNGYNNENKSKKKYPEKEHARRLLQYAVKTGRIKKTPCVKCGSIKSQGHHDDYFKPLKVIWLCAPHHREAHKKINQ